MLHTLHTGKAGRHFVNHRRALVTQLSMERAMALRLVGESPQMDEGSARKMDKAARRLWGGNANAYTSRATAPDSCTRKVRTNSNTLARSADVLSRPCYRSSGEK